MIRVCLIGLGKTGCEISRVLLDQKDIKLVAVVCSPSSIKKGKDLGEILGCLDTGISIESADNMEQIVFKAKPDVVVDFSSPKATIRNARILTRLKVGMVIGTTGFTPFSIKKLYVFAKKNHSGIVYAPNITLGVNVLMVLANLASSILSNYNFQILEVHHKNKKDAPSGTAVKIAKEIEKGMKASGEFPGASSVPITAIRAGGVVGKHEVMIIGEDDKIEISHESFSRKAFALGAIRAVKYIKGRTGFYEMNDVLNLDSVLSSYLERENKKQKKKYPSYSPNTADEVNEVI